MTRLVVSSDWHPDFNMMGVPRFDEVEAAVKQSLDFAIENEADYYLFLGDLANPDTGGDTFRAIDLAGKTALRCARSDITWIGIAGNHDICTDGTGATTLTPLRALEEQWVGRIRVIEAPTSIVLKHDSLNLILLCLPYTAPSHSYDAAMVMKVAMDSAKRKNQQVIVVGHLMLTGIHPGSETTDHPRGRDVAFPVKETTGALLRLNGHYHQQQEFAPGDGGPKIQIPGSVARLAFGEEKNKPSFLVIDV